MKCKRNVMFIFKERRFDERIIEARRNEKISAEKK
jgi:hypothetical protein